VSDAPVRVCHVITRLELGGAQENTLYTVAHLRPPFAPSLVCGPGGLLDAEARAIPGLELCFVPSLVRPIRPGRDLAATLALWRLFRRLRPAIVHTHSSKAGILGRLAAWLAGAPVVVHSIHGFGFHDRQAAPLRRLLIGAERLAARGTTRFVAVSRANLETGARLGIVEPQRARLIRSGIPVAVFTAAAARREAARAALRRELGWPPEAPVIGMIACLKPQKAPGSFVEVAARVAAARPDARFLIAGDGELRAAVETRVRQLGLRDRLRLLGWRRDIPQLLAALDVMLLTSLWEGLPKVVPEAIAAGVPVVATSVDGTNDILQDGVTGLVAPPDDPQGLAARVLRLLEEPALGKALTGRAGALLPEFDIDRMVRAQEDLYLELLQTAPRAGSRAACANA
jgi:glycosyltransferase involved in cell wall biosynthesis